MAAEYPPDHHLLRDLRMTSTWIEEDELRFVAPLVPEVATVSGAMALGPLFAVADVALVTAAIGFADQDWCGTLDLGIRMKTDVIGGPLVVVCEVVRVGGTLITTAAEIFDGQGTTGSGVLVGKGIATSRRMPRNEEFNSAPPAAKVVGEQQRWGRPASGFTVPVLEQLGCDEVGPGVIELEKWPYVTNSFGTINGGTTGILICAGAESALGGEFVATDVEVRYIGQASDGPVRTMCEVIRVGVDHAVVDVTVIDLSRERRPIATGAVTLTAASR